MSIKKAFTIFTVPKGFEGLYKTIQTNSIKSWLSISPKPEIMLFGSDPGVKEFAKKSGVIHISDIKRNKFGTPRIDDIFIKAKKKAKTKYLCYLNADIIVDPKLPKIISTISQNYKEFLAIARRWNLKIEKQINFNKKNWFEMIEKKALKKGELYSHTGIDLFFYNKRLFKKIPNFAVGRTIWDNWLMYYARSKKIPIIDITNALTLIHQDHSYKKFVSSSKHFRKGEEGRLNLKAAGGYYYCLTAKDADYKMDKNLELSKNTHSWFYTVDREARRQVHKFIDKYIYF